MGVCEQHLDTDQSVAQTRKDAAWELHSEDTLPISGTRGFPGEQKDTEMWSSKETLRGRRSSWSAPGCRETVGGHSVLPGRVMWRGRKA